MNNWISEILADKPLVMQKGGDKHYLEDEVEI
jgi:hypothetical protein